MGLPLWQELMVYARTIESNSKFSIYPYYLQIFSTLSYAIELTSLSYPLHSAVFYKDTSAGYPAITYFFFSYPSNSFFATENLSPKVP